MFNFLHNLEAWGDFTFLLLFIFNFCFFEFQSVKVLGTDQMQLFRNQIFTIVIAFWRIARESIVPTLGKFFDQERVWTKGLSLCLNLLRDWFFLLCDNFLLLGYCFDILFFNLRLFDFLFFGTRWLQILLSFLLSHLTSFLLLSFPLIDSSKFLFTNPSFLLFLLVNNNLMASFL
jgi:hypothetical protein